MERKESKASLGSLQFQKFFIQSKNRSYQMRDWEKDSKNYCIRNENVTPFAKRRAVKISRGGNSKKR
jgi:hypothetical protein